MKHILIAILLTLPFILHSQSELGTPFIQNIDNNHLKNIVPQIFDIEKADNGAMFFANTSGVFVYDGVRTELIKLPKNSYVKTLKKDSTGRIYIGAEDDFGYLEPDSLNRPAFVSLYHLIPEKYSNFRNFWEILPTKYGVFFQTSQNTFIYANDTIMPVDSTKTLYYPFIFNNDVYFRGKENFFYKYSTDSLIPIENSKITASYRLDSYAKYSETEYIITSEAGVFFLDINNAGNKIRKDPQFDELEKQISTKRIFELSKVNDSTYALATSSGVYVFNQKGDILHVLDKSKGLKSDAAYSVFTDEYENLWVGQDNGFSYVIFNSAFTVFDENSGIQSAVSWLKYFQNKIYVASGNNAFVGENYNFKAIENTKTQNWQIFTLDDNVFTLNNFGAYKINSLKAENYMYIWPWKIIKLKHKDGYLLSGTDNNLQLLKQNGSEFDFLTIIDGFTEQARFFEEDYDGCVWVTKEGAGVYRLKFNEQMDSVINLKLYNSDDGLPSNLGNIVFEISPMPMSYYQGNEKTVAFYTVDGIYHFDYENDKFYKDTLLKKEFLFDKNVEERPVKQDFEKNIFLRADSIVQIHVNQNGKYEIYTKPFVKILEKNIYCIEDLDKNHIMFGSDDAIFVYNKRAKQNFNIPFKCHITSIFSNNSIIDGRFFENNIDSPVFEYKNNKMLFYFSSDYYEETDKNMFSYKLEGFDTEWSTWNYKTEKEYTNLSEGKYTFYVKSKNLYSEESLIDQFSFSIMPPWHRTWWAYMLYFVTAIFAVFVVVKIYTRRLIKQKEQLENIVKQRTAEVVQQKEEIEAQANSLADANVEISKSHKQITDSINYAKKIQSAVLTEYDEISEILPHNFILFKPRDIVSGDFFYIKQVNNITLIVAADCTGHGVPGAFMSMLGVAFLNEIVKNQKINSASKVLEELRKRVKYSLKQTGIQKGASDGMDMAFCAINNNTLELNFAGAYNPCWIFRKNAENDEVVFFELKANRQPIGIYLREKPFDEQKFQLKKDDVFYIFSDGYDSQFGGEKHEKFRQQNMKNLFFEICQLPMNEQKQILDETLINWQGTNKQTDDILVIGVKI